MYTGTIPMSAADIAPLCAWTTVQPSGQSMWITAVPYLGYTETSKETPLGIIDMTEHAMPPLNSL